MTPRKKFRLDTLFPTILLFAVSMPGNAYLIDNGVPDIGTSYVSDFDAGQQVADNFTLTQDANLTQIEWWGIYLYNNSPATDSFTVRIFADNGSGAPQITPTNLAGTLTRSGTGQTITVPVFFTSVTADIYHYTLDLGTALNLTAGDYWLSIVNDTATDTNDNWYWLTSNANSGNARSRPDDGTPWNTGLGNEMAFRISGTTVSPTPPGTVPEPAALSLLGLGLLLLRRHIS